MLFRTVSFCLALFYSLTHSLTQSYQKKKKKLTSVQTFRNNAPLQNPSRTTDLNIDLQEKSLHKPSATKYLKKHTLPYSHPFVSSSTPVSAPLPFPGCSHSPWVILSSPLSFFLTFYSYIFISLILPLASP